MTGAAPVVDYDASAIDARDVRDEVECLLDGLRLRKLDGAPTTGADPGVTTGRPALVVGDLHRLWESWGPERLNSDPPWVARVLLVRTDEDRRLLRDPDIALRLSERHLVFALGATDQGEPSAHAALLGYLSAVVDRMRPDRVRTARFAAPDDVLWLEFGDGLARALTWSRLSFASRTTLRPVFAVAQEDGRSVLVVDGSGAEMTVDAEVLRAEADAGYRAAAASSDASERAATGARLRRLREERGLSQQQVAALSGVPQESLSRIENGRRDPRLDTLKKLAAALDTDVARLLEDISAD